ncbi:MAG: TolC family protein, partial [Bacteroidetes bacterium]
MKKMLLFLIIIPSFAFTLTIERVLQLAFSNNTDLLSMRNNLKIKEMNIKNLRLSYFPTVTLDYNLAKNVVSHKFSENSISSTLNYSLYDGGAKILSFRLALAELEKLQTDYIFQKQNLEYRVKKAYYNIVLNKNIAKIYEKAMSQAVLELRTAEEKFKEGMIDSLTLESARQYYLDAEYQLLMDKNALKSGKNELMTLIGGSFTEEIEGELKSEKPEKLSNDLRLIRLEKETEIVKLHYEQALAENGWSVSLSGNANLNWQGGDTQPSYFFQAGLNIYFPLFDFLSVHGNVSHDFEASGSDSIGAGVNLFDQNNNAIIKKTAELNKAAEIKKI